MSDAEAGRQFYARVFALTAAGVLAVLLSRILLPFAGPIGWALLLALLLAPVNRALRRRLGERPGLAALLLTLGVTVLILGPATWLIVAFAGQAGDLIGHIQAAAGRYRVTRIEDLLGLPALARLVTALGRLVPVTPVEVEGWLVEGSKALLQGLVGASQAILTRTLGALFELLLTLFFLFFGLRDGEVMTRSLVRLVPLDAARKARLLDHLSAVTRAVVYGSLLTALAQGTLVGLAFGLAGLPSPVVFAVVAAVAALVPLFGTALVWAPAAGALALGGRPWAALFLAVWGGVVVSSVDNVVRPLFISGRAQISTLPVFVGLLGGASAFGAIGLFLGPVVVALAIALLRFALEGGPEDRA